MNTADFLRKYIDLMRYDKLDNSSLPFLFFIAIHTFAVINVGIAILVDSGNTERSILAVADILICSIHASNMIKRNLNYQDAINWLQFIADDFTVDYNNLKDNDELMGIIQKYFKEKRESMRAMCDTIAKLFIFLTFMTQCKNVMINISLSFSLDSLENDSNDWPTPFLSYCPPDLKSPIFFVYTFSVQFLLHIIYYLEGYYIISSVYLSTEKVLVDSEIINIISKHLVKDFSESDCKIDDCGEHEFKINQGFKSYKEATEMQKLRKNMALMVYCHQKLNRDFKICMDGSKFMLTITNLVIMLYSCMLAYLMLRTDDLEKVTIYGAMFVFINLTVFSAHHNGQRLFNQNDVLRQSLASLPWINKPDWFKKTLYIMMTRANVNNEMRPYGIYSLSYLSFKDLVKTAFSFGNILYSRKLTSQA